MRKFTRTNAAAVILLGMVGCQHNQLATTEPSTQPTTEAATEPTTMSATTEPIAPPVVVIPPPVEPTPTTEPTAAATAPAAAPTAAAAPPAEVEPEVPGVVAKKPFIKWPTIDALQAQPSPLLVQHARSDSPIPLSQYSSQPTHSMSEFALSRKLSGVQVQQRFGPPAQLADESDEWLVYRLTLHRELWLHFSLTNGDRLTAAEVIAPVEDGYTRQIVFPTESNP